MPSRTQRPASIPRDRLSGCVGGLGPKMVPGKLVDAGVAAAQKMVQLMRDRDAGRLGHLSEAEFTAQIKAAGEGMLARAEDLARSMRR